MPAAALQIPVIAVDPGDDRLDRRQVDMVVGVDLRLVSRTEGVGAVRADGQPRIDDTIRVFRQTTRNTGRLLSAALGVPENITILPLSPKSPELNPDENLWQFMRDNFLFNRILISYTNIVDHCCNAWNRIIDQSWKIVSIGLRLWAHGF